MLKMRAKEGGFQPMARGLGMGMGGALHAIKFYPELRGAQELYI